jgi:hypothetical protein
MTAATTRAVTTAVTLLLLMTVTPASAQPGGPPPGVDRKRICLDADTPAEHYRCRTRETVLVEGEGCVSGDDRSCPPARPTRREVLGVCPHPQPAVIHHNPVVEGVTGVETWLWASHPDQPTYTATTLNGHPVTCQVRATRYEWTTGDGGRYVTDHPGGDPPAHAVAHTYQRKSPDYVLVLTVTWTRTTNTHGSDTFTLTTHTPYQVVEIIPRLIS